MHYLRRLFIVAICLVLAACTSVPPRGLAGARFVSSPNFDERRPDLVVIHHTGNNSVQEALDILTAAPRKVSAHYLIGRDGRILQLVDERARAWHAGVSWWMGARDVNSRSIGIELDNNGSEPFPEVQIDALLVLLADLGERYRIPTANYVGHVDVAPGRKVDPSVWFPWDELARHGFGRWCDAPFAPAPAGFDLDLALTALGYDLTRPEVARQAFVHHFAKGRPLDMRQQQALAYCLLG
ncbi:MAG: N-acetylmuramoyl-L-alanine amidase [Castellaniella sp.]